MTTSYNTAPGGLHYSPERDFSYNYPRMVSCVIRSFNMDNYWSALLETLSQTYPGGKDALWSDVCKAKDYYCDFLNTCCQDPTETVADVLKRSGFTDLPEPAKIAWMAMLGDVVTGQIFQGVRDVTEQGTVHSSIVKLLAAGQAGARAVHGLPVDADNAQLTTAFENMALTLRERGMSQQDIRKALADAFNKEQYLV